VIESILPPEITFTKDRIQDQWVYTFRHEDLGEIGRVRLKGIGKNTMINLDITGDPNDPMTEKRREIFEPLGMQIADQMESIVGRGTENPVPTPPPVQGKTRVMSKLMQCEKCGAYVATLIFPDNAWTPDRLEDYARMMYSEYSERNLPTWIIGSPLDKSENPPAHILKVWPEREPVCIMTPDEFNPMLNKIQETHCD